MAASDPTSPAAPAGIDWFADAEDAVRWRGWWRRAAPSPELTAARERFARLAAAFAAPEGRDAAEWAALLREASESFLVALARDFEREDDQQTVASAMHAGVNRELAAHAAPVRCGVVFPSARFDPDTMEAVEALSGNRFVVHRVLTWLVRDVSDARPKVAARARVVTA